MLSKTFTFQQQQKSVLRFVPTPHAHKIYIHTVWELLSGGAWLAFRENFFFFRENFFFFWNVWQFLWVYYHFLSSLFSI